MKRNLLLPITIFLGVVQILIGCTSRLSPAKMETAYDLLNTNPDSAVSILSAIDRKELNISDKAYCSLLYTMALDKSGPDVDNDSLIRVAYDFYKTRASDSLYAKCMFYMGKYYVLNDSIKQGLRCLELAARSSEDNGDLYTQYLALDRLGMALKLSDSRKAVRLEKRAYEIFCSYDSTNLYNRVILLKNIGNCYDMLNEKDSAMFYMREALNLAGQTQNRQLLSDTYHSMSVAWQQRNMPDSALIYIRKAVELAPRVKNSSYLQLANCYMDLDSLDQAERVLHEISMIGDSRMAYSVFRELLHIELARQGNVKASLYVDSTLNSLAKIYQEAQKNNYGYLQNTLDLSASLEQSEREKVLMSVIYSFAFFLVVIAIVFIGYIYYNRRKVALRESQMRIKELSINNALILADKEKQALILSSKEKQVEIMRNYIIKVSNIEATLKSIKDKSQFDQLSDETWLEITSFLNETEANFVDVLSERYPELSSRDIRFLMLVKLGFTNSELEKFCLRSPQGIKQRLLNYKAKLGIDNREISTREFILHHFEG
ncbi:MAG: hypothetical protein MJZ73_06480 [Bacteroidaceae bacterium]|nr:hypothetical protein [Bacteroidaceae bacterium]